MSSFSHSPTAPARSPSRDPPPNLYRFGGDHGQGVAGLGTYAYRELGWRDAAVVLFNWDMGWGARDAFVSEFCSLGGRIGSQVALEEFDPAGGDVASVPRGVDGVAVFVPSTFDPEGFLKRLAGRYADPSRHILLGPAVVDDPTLLGPTRGALAGVVGSSYVDPVRMRRYLAAYREAFPGTSADVAGERIGQRLSRCGRGAVGRARRRRREAWTACHRRSRTSGWTCSAGRCSWTGIGRR